MSTIKPFFWTNINDITDNVLQAILRYGTIEDIVSMERVSNRFKAVTSSVLRVKKTFETKTNFFKLKDKFDHESDDDYNLRIVQVFNLLKRMPKLVDMGIITSWKRDQVEEMAKINPNLRRHFLNGLPQIGTDSHRIYIEAVKSLNPGYTANNVQLIFTIDMDIVELMLLHSDLKVKLDVSGVQMDMPGADQCYSLRLFEVDDRIDTYQVYPGVEVLRMDEDYGRFEDIKLFPNLKSLELIGLLVSGIKLRNVYPNIRSKLEFVKIYIKKLDVEDVHFIKKLMNEHPLKGFEMEVTEDYDENLIVKTVLECNNLTLKSLDLKSFWLHKNVMSIGHNGPGIFVDTNVLKQVLARFEKVGVLRILFEIDEEKLETIKNICHEMECLNHRRSVLDEVIV